MKSHPKCACSGAMTLMFADWHIIGWPWEPDDLCLSARIILAHGKWQPQDRVEGGEVRSALMQRKLTTQRRQQQARARWPMRRNTMRCTHIKSGGRGTNWSAMVFSSRRVTR